MSDPVDRPRPQYGEYATPEEQRSRIQHPAAGEALSAGISPSAIPAVVPAPAFATPAVPAQAPARAPRAWDRVLTIALLAFGAVNVLFSAFSYFNLAETASAAMQTLGVPGEFTNVDAARTWGIAAAIVLVVGYLITAIVSIRSLRRGRLTWWIPVVGAVVTLIAVTVCISVPISSDPAFIDFVTSSRS